MALGEIHYGRFPIVLDSNGNIDPVTQIQLGTFFPPGDYDNVVAKIVPISGGSGKSNAVMVVFARRIS